MIIPIAIIWTALSLGAIYYDDKWHRSKMLFIVFASATILGFILIGTSLFDASLSHYIGGVIELNPTWDMTLITAFIIGMCITGPVALAHTLYIEIRFKIHDKKKEKEYKERLKRRG